MNYFLDTEFIEGTQVSSYLGGFIKIGQHKPTIDLISIGIVAEDGREYYAISKDFNLKEAWNRHDVKINKHYPMGPEYLKEYWIRDNVLKPIWEEKCKEGFTFKDSPMTPHGIKTLFTYKNFKKLINTYGKTNKQIAIDIQRFVYSKEDVLYIDEDRRIDAVGAVKSLIEFYAYYADYDWVAFCWLFGRMIDLPKGFPMYCRDLKQILDDKAQEQSDKLLDGSFKHCLNFIEMSENYPRQSNEHDALADAKWNFELYKFLKKMS